LSYKLVFSRSQFHFFFLIHARTHSSRLIYKMKIFSFSSNFKKKSQQISNGATDGSAKPGHNNRHEVGEDESLRFPRFPRRGLRSGVALRLGDVGIVGRVINVDSVVNFCDWPSRVVTIDVWRHWWFDVFVGLVETWIEAWRRERNSSVTQPTKADSKLLPDPLSSSSSSSRPSPEPLSGSLSSITSERGGNDEKLRTLARLNYVTYPLATTRCRFRCKRSSSG
jgi:hypothetical protein